MPKNVGWKRKAQIAVGNRLAKMLEVADCVHNRGMTVRDTAQRVGISIAQVTRYSALIDHHFLAQMQDSTHRALAQHIARLQSMQQDAYEQMQAAQHNGHKIQWFKVRLEALRDIARLMGFEQAAKTLVFERGDERFAIVSGGVEDLVELRRAMQTRPNNAYLEAYEEVRSPVEGGSDVVGVR